MSSERNLPRFLGATFLLVIVASAVGGMTFNSAVGSGSISDILVNTANNVTLMRISMLADMLNTLGIVALAVLLYSVLSKQNRVVALVALGWWLGEAIFYAVGKIGAFALIPLSLEFVQAGTPEHSIYQTLGSFLYYGVAREAVTIHMWFYCAGGLLWYSLFYQSKYIPRAIPAFGILAVSVGLVGLVLEFFGSQVPIAAYLPIGLFELTIGIWLLLRGTRMPLTKLT